ncbi:MAG TPA: hypothetical protein VNA69_06910 [Thermoanaerobaculia bacterium]|nr:hypothetical protein [Thermoanaerobaculia bacterium]
MTVVESGTLQSRYERISDRLKATWTSHQFVSGAFRHFLGAPLPYEVDFTSIYDQTRELARLVDQSRLVPAIGTISQIDTALSNAAKDLIRADDRISASLLRRFFEKMKKQDDTIIEYLIKFYLYTDAVEGDRRDKLDYLFTRLGEEREALDLRHRIISLVAVLRVAPAPREEVISLIRAVRSMREEIESVAKFDDLTERNLLRDARTFKHRVGDLFFDPDVLLAVIELNVAARNRFLRLYAGEEQRVIEDSAKLMEHGQAIERNFGEANPALVEEFARFREFKERFDSLRAQSNVKHEVVARLKASMSNIVAQLDRGLDVYEEAAPEPPAAFYDETQQSEDVASRFGRNEPLAVFLLRIAAAIDAAGAAASSEELVQSAAVRDLRLESWEVLAYQKLFGRQAPEAEEDNDELWMLYLRAAALRMKVDEEATILATAMAAGVRPESELLAKAKQSLDLAKELDELFGDLLQEAVYYSNRRILHQLYRSRFRLLRGFSGLWLIYDRQS